MGVGCNKSPRSRATRRPWQSGPVPPQPDGDVDRVDEEVLAAAREVVASRSPAFRSAILAESALGQRRSPRSDLDLVVIEDGAVSRWEGTHGGRWPVEMFIGDLEGWERCVATEVRDRRPLVLQITATGVPLTTNSTTTDVQRNARRLLTRGPSPLTPSELGLQRRLLTDLVDDLEDARQGSERHFVIEATFRQSAELWLMSNRQWLGWGKWLARALSETAPELSDELAVAVQASHQGDISRLVAVAQLVLQDAGGPVRSDWVDPLPPANATTEPN